MMINFQNSNSQIVDHRSGGRDWMIVNKLSKGSGGKKNCEMKIVRSD